MGFSYEDKVLIKNLYLIKGYRARKLMSQFPQKNWKRSSLNILLKKLLRREEREWPAKAAGTAQNVSTVEELAMSQENQSNTHHACVWANGGHFDQML